MNKKNNSLSVALQPVSAVSDFQHDTRVNTEAPVYTVIDIVGIAYIFVWDRPLNHIREHCAAGSDGLTQVLMPVCIFIDFLQPFRFLYESLAQPFRGNHSVICPEGDGVLFRNQDILVCPRIHGQRRVEGVENPVITSAALDRLQDDDERYVLRAYYIDGLQWDQIALKVPCAERTVYDIRLRGLKSVANILQLDAEK